MLQASYSSQLAAGCDEVGRGCLAGPIVAAAVILPQDYTNLLLKDSKQLTAQQRLWLNALIREEALDWAIGCASVSEIDQLNVLKASHLAMHRAIAQLEIVPEVLLIDGQYFKAYPTIRHRCIVRGDQQHSAIAAASVLAKVYRDQYMQELALQVPGYSWEHNKGYPTLVHRKAIHNLGVTSHHRKGCQAVSRQLHFRLWSS